MRERRKTKNANEYILHRQIELRAAHMERDSLYHIVSLALDAIEAKDRELIDCK